MGNSVPACRLSTTPRVRYVCRLHPMGAYMRLFNAGGLATPWLTIYILAEHRYDAWLLAHERAHITQIRRDGHLTYWARYIWWMIRDGYDRHPYEIEANAMADRSLMARLNLASPDSYTGAQRTPA